MNYTNKITMALCMVFLGLTAQAQGGFGAPALKITALNNQTGLFFGGMGAATYGDYYFGGIGMGLTNGDLFETEADGETVSNLSMGYGGLLLGYNRDLLLPLNVYAQGAMAWGSYSWQGQGDGSNFFLLEPEVGINLITGRTLNVGLGIGYRFTLPTTRTAFPLDNLNGMSTTLSFKFGNL